MLDIFGLLVGECFSLLLCLHSVRPGSRQSDWVRHIGKHDAVDFSKIEVMILKLLKEIPG